MFLSRCRPASARGHHTPGRAQPRRSADARLPPLIAPVSVDRPVRSRRFAALAPREAGLGSGSRRLGGRPRVPCPPRDAAAPARRRRDTAGRWARCSLCRETSAGARGRRVALLSVSRLCIDSLALFILLGYYYLEIKHGALVVGCRAQRNRDGRCAAACASSLVTRRPPAPVREPFMRPRPPSRSGRPRGKRPIQRTQRSERARGAPVGRSRC